jgi:transcriptional regulator with XRE-family HTH domain
VRKSYDFTKGKRNVYAKRLKANPRTAKRWDYIDGNPIERNPEYQRMFARMDIANQIAEGMQRAGLSKSQLAKRTRTSVATMNAVLSGDEDMTVNYLVNLFNVLGCRFDLVVTPRNSNEWDTKRWIEELEKQARREPRKKSNHRR